MEVTFTTAPWVRLQFLQQAPRQQDRREEIHLEHPPPVSSGVSSVPSRAAALRLGRDAGIVDQGVQLARGQAAAGSPPPPAACRRGRRGRPGYGPPAPSPMGSSREGVARAGDDAPARRREALHGSMADAARSAGEQQDSARLVGSLINKAVPSGSVGSIRVPAV